MGTEVELCGEKHGEVMAGWLRHNNLQSWDVWTSLPVVTEEHRLTVLRIVDSDCQPGGDMIGQVFELGHFICHPVEIRVEDTGEVIEEARTILIQSNTQPISFVSSGVIKSIQKIIWATGRKPPFDPPLKVQLKQRSLKGGKRTFLLVPVKE